MPFEITPEKQKWIEEYFNKVNRDTLHLIDEFYAADLVFEDPVGRIEGLEGLRKYLEHTYAGVEECRFEFHDMVVQGPSVVACWTMHFRHRKLKGGKKLVSHQGCSHMTFNDAGLVAHHRDYLDMGAMLYEHLPLIGTLVRWIKNKL